MNLDHLKDVTDGDIAVQKNLIQLYYNAVDRALYGLQESLPLNKNEQWQIFAHELKGASLSVGFYDISDLCQTAYDVENLMENDKRIIVRQIESFLGEVTILTHHLR